jgi:probable phosphoglycerate mutase
MQADGASRGNPGEASYGVIILDDAGIVVAELSERIGFATNNEAEYRGVIAGLRLISERFPGEKVRVELDSKLVVEQASGRWKINAQGLKPLLAEVQRLISGRRVEFHWIPRERNFRADALANLALDSAASNLLEASSGLPQPSSVRAPLARVAPTDLYLIRHGSTSDTHANLVSGGSSDPELSERGEAEALSAATGIREVSKQFGLELPKLLIHSPQRRAKQTAEIIASRIDADTQQVEELREISFGDWEGLSQAELAVLPDAAAWRGSMQESPPNGESLVQLEARVLPVLERAILDNSGRAIGLVSHMMPTRAMLARLLSAGPGIYWGMNLKPASISALRSFGTELVEAHTINYCGHLRTE